METFAYTRERAGIGLGEATELLGASHELVEKWDRGAVPPPARVIQVLKGLALCRTGMACPTSGRESVSAPSTQSAARTAVSGGTEISQLQQASFAFDDAIARRTPERGGKERARSGTFTDNMSLPVHRWFRYSAGFSAEWVDQLLQSHKLSSDSLVLDPFVGSGTTLLAAQTRGVNAVGAEAHHFVRRIASAKLAWPKVCSRELRAAAADLSEKAKIVAKKIVTPDDGLLARCYTTETLTRLIALREVYASDYAAYGPISELLWLAITSILRECSGVGTAQWQYLLPNRSKARAQEPFTAFAAKVMLISSDIDFAKRSWPASHIKLLAQDARSLSDFTDARGRVSLVVCSPPYPNNYDYADATRLEMTFWGEVENWGDLQDVVRRHLIRSCSQHSAAENLVLDRLLSDAHVAPIREELTTVCNALARVRETKGGKKTYHTMIAAYFSDLARTWRELHSMCAPKAEVNFVIGDSAPYGVYVPVDAWLGSLAVAAGFRSWEFEKLRDRNVKWKNRKHRVPLKEGILRVHL